MSVSDVVLGINWKQTSIGNMSAKRPGKLLLLLLIRINDDTTARNEVIYNNGDSCNIRVMSGTICVIIIAIDCY